MAATVGLACDTGQQRDPVGIMQALASSGEQVSVEVLCRSIDLEQAALYGIQAAEWRASDTGIPFPHCKVLFSLARSGAEYSGDGGLLDFNQNIPTTAISRVGECLPKTPVAHAILFPGGSQDQTGTIGRNAFRLLGSPANECISVTTIYYPSHTILERIGEEEALFSPPSSGRDFLIATHAVSHLARDLLEELFFGPRAIFDGLVACFGLSYGGAFGFQLATERPGTVCDGTLLSVSGDGGFPLTDLRRSVCAGDRRIPLTGQSADFCATQDLADAMGVFDSEFRAQIVEVLADPSQGELAAQQLLAAYDIATRPQRVQREAAFLTPTGALQGKVLMVQGTHDDRVPAILALRYDERVLAQQREGLFRFYLANGLGHDQVVNFSSAAAGRLLLRWMAGEEPGALVFTVPSVGTMTVLNSTAAGFAEDPCGYFDFTVGSTVCRDSGLFR